MSRHRKIFENTICQFVNCTAKVKSSNLCGPHYRLSRIEAFKVYEKRKTLKRSYGLTIEEYEEMIKMRGGRCDICHKVLPLDIDHNHKTGKIRGLLCHACNIGLGMFQDNLLVLETAILYLKR